MRISTEIGSAALQVGEARAIEYVAGAGFQGWDLSMFSMVRYDWSAGRLLASDHPLAGGKYLSYVRELRKIGEDNGILCNQSHAPFPTAHPGIRDLLKRAIECTAEAGAEICVIHPDNNASPAENAEFYQTLLPFARDHRVKIATENMWNWDDRLGRSSPAACSTGQNFLAHMELVNDPFFVACLDIGHAEMLGSGSGAPAMIRTLGQHLQALHIHDNDLLHDSHQIPFSMNIDFCAVAAALKDIGYSGWLTLEADSYLAAFEAEDIPAAMKNMACSANRLKAMIE